MLKFYSKFITDNDWDTMAIKMLIGEISPENLLISSKHENPKKEKEQKCRAYYFIGQFYLINDDKTKGKSYLMNI